MVAMYNVIRSAMPGVNEGVLGGEMPSDMVLGVIGDATQSDEAIVGIMVTTDGNALVATEQRLLIATQQGLECDCVYEDITAFEVRTGWLKRGISFISSRGDFECATEDGDAVVVMGNIIRGRTPHIDSPVIAEDGGWTGGQGEADVRHGYRWRHSQVRGVRRYRNRCTGRACTATKRPRWASWLRWRIRWRRCVDLMMRSIRG